VKRSRRSLSASIPNNRISRLHFGHTMSGETVVSLSVPFMLGNLRFHLMKGHSPKRTCAVQLGMSAKDQ
jgi:hypothetical protein